MTSEAICCTISELGLSKLSSKFYTLASLHAKQSTSSEEVKGVVSAQPYSKYSSLILFTNSEPNSPILRSFTLDTNRQTHTPSELDLPRTSELEDYYMLMTQPSCQYVRANCKLCFMSVNNGVFEIAHKLIQKKQNNGLLRNPCPPPRPGESSSARPNHTPLSRVLTLLNLRSSLVPYPRSLPI